MEEQSCLVLIVMSANKLTVKLRKLRAGHCNKLIPFFMRILHCSRAKKKDLLILQTPDLKIFALKFSDASYKKQWDEAPSLVTLVEK